AIRLGKMTALFQGDRWTIGSTSRRQADIVSCAPSEADVSRLRSLGQTTFGLTGAASSFLGSFWGIRGRFRDRYPALGAFSLDGGLRRLWVALGFYKNGLQLGPLFARDLVRSILDGTPSGLGPRFEVSRLLP